MLHPRQNQNRQVSPNPQLKRAGHKGPRCIPTNLQRQALRKWWNDDSYGKRKQEDAMEWWKQQYGTELARLTASDILSKKYAHLNGLDLNQHQATV